MRPDCSCSYGIKCKDKLLEEKDMNGFLSAVVQGLGLALGLALMSVLLHATLHIGFCG